MGREQLFKKLKGKGIFAIVAGIFITLIGIFMTFVMLTDGFSPVVLAFIAIAIGGLVFVYFGMDNLKGENSRFVKTRPGILELADDIYLNKVYENDFIVISNKAIAAKNDICKISALEDVLAIYERIERTNGIVTGHTVVLQLRDGKQLIFSVYAKKREVKDDLVLTISNYCPNAKVGYTGETLQYIAEQRKLYKESMGK